VDFTRWSKEVVARDEQHVGLRLLSGIDAPVDANLARESVGLLSAWVSMTLGARATFHAHQEGQAAIGVHSQDAHLHAGRSLEEGTVGLDRILIFMVLPSHSYFADSRQIRAKSCIQ